MVSVSQDDTRQAHVPLSSVHGSSKLEVIVFVALSKTSYSLICDPKVIRYLSTGQLASAVSEVCMFILP
jgi:hypothetical protein